MEVVARSNANIFVMENVPQLLASEEFNEIEKCATKLGFLHLAKAKLCAADYGVPQVRYRAFIIGCKFADPTLVFPPLKTHYNPVTSASFHGALRKAMVPFSSLMMAPPQATARHVGHNQWPYCV